MISRGRGGGASRAALAARDVAIVHSGALHAQLNAESSLYMKPGREGRGEVRVVDPFGNRIRLIEIEAPSRTAPSRTAP